MLDLYMVILLVGVVVLVPFAVGSAIFTLGLHAADRAQDARVPKPFLRLSLVLTLNSVVAAIAAVYFAFVVLYRALLGPTPEGLIAFSALAVVALEMMPILTTVYLASLRRRSKRETGRHRPPP